MNKHITPQGHGLGWNKLESEKLELLIEDWVIIDVKDPLYVKEAKIKARHDFKVAIENLIALNVEATRQSLLSEIAEQGPKDFRRTIKDNTYTDAHQTGFNSANYRWRELLTELAKEDKEVM